MHWDPLRGPLSNKSWERPPLERTIHRLHALRRRRKEQLVSSKTLYLGRFLCQSNFTSTLIHYRASVFFICKMGNTAEPESERNANNSPRYQIKGLAGWGQLVGA